MVSKRILVVDDEQDINEIITFALLAEGYEVFSAYTLIEAREILSTGIYDLVILDLSLPDGDGLELLKEIRESLRKLPVIVLTARSNPEDIDLGLIEGATDYLSKPFRSKELVLRSRNILGMNLVKSEVYSYKNCSVNGKTKRAFVDNREVKLTFKEFKLLYILISNQDTLLSRAQIYNQIWGVIDEPDYHRLEAIVSNLRKKMKKYQFTSIKTNTQRGYYLG